jgi:hypothetical protein
VSGSVIAVAVRRSAVAIEERVGLGFVFVCTVCHAGVGVVTFIQGVWPCGPWPWAVWPPGRLASSLYGSCRASHHMAHRLLAGPGRARRSGSSRAWPIGLEVRPRHGLM